MRPKELFTAAYGLVGAASAESARTIEGWFQGASARAIASVAAAARTEFRYGVWPGYVTPQAPLDDARLDAFDPSARLAVAALLSLHRSGYVRQLGLTFLARSEDARVIPYLLLRADDIVATLRAASERAIAERLRPELAVTFARALPLVELFGRRERGGQGSLVRSIRNFLVDPLHHAALVEATRDGDHVVRRLAFALRLRTEPPEHVLRAALADADTGIRRFAARTIGCASAPDPTDLTTADEAELTTAAKTFSLKDLAAGTGGGVSPITIDGFERTLVIPGATKFAIRNDGFHTHRIALRENGPGPALKAAQVKAGSKVTFNVVDGTWYQLLVDFVDANGTAQTDVTQFQFLASQPQSGGGGGGGSGGFGRVECERAGGRWVVIVESGMGCNVPSHDAPLPGGG